MAAVFLLTVENASLGKLGRLDHLHPYPLGAMQKLLCALVAATERPDIDKARRGGAKSKP